MKQLFLIGCVFLSVGACQQKPKQQENSSHTITLRDTEKVPPIKKRSIPRKVIPPSPTFTDTLNNMFLLIIPLHNEEILRDSLPNDDWVEKHFVIKRVGNDSITETLFIQKEDSVIQHYRMFYVYQNTVAESDTLEDIIVDFYKDTLGIVQYTPYQHEQYVINDTLKQSKTFIPAASSYDVTKNDLKRILAMLSKK